MAASRVSKMAAQTVSCWGGSQSLLHNEFARTQHLHQQVLMPVRVNASLCSALCAFIARFTTTPVMTVLLVVGVVALGRLLARTMVFPGCVSAISKGMEREVASRMRSRLSVAIFHVSFALQVSTDMLNLKCSCASKRALFSC